ncbi:serine protease snake-like [Uranotaenia lowii]|uniref:serine protease snake-like n=1 Tax=Uranotaenia lowii TaxID=190385 RepID=UPI002478512F|nr:serine protease snake-like [Uranotaenia lowii]
MRADRVLSCLIAVGLILSFNKVSTKKVLGDPCNINAQSGICKLRADCPEIEDIINNGERPQICAYGQNRQKIFCCPTLEPDRTNKKLRKSEMYCNRWRELASRKEFFRALSMNEKDTRTIAVQDCVTIYIPLIKGGRPSIPNEFPHMAALGFYDELGKFVSKCGGTLISDRFVLTAAHCIFLGKNDHLTTVKLGQNDLRNANQVNSLQQDYGIRNTIHYPEYKNKYHDVALIELDRTVQFSNKTRPACLWSSPDFSFTKAVALGYGATEPDGDNTKVLKLVAMEILKYDECSGYFLNYSKLKNSTIESQLCTLTGSQGDRDTCQGDSGGPLQVVLHDHDCLYYVIGVTSTGPACGHPDSAAIYSRVWSFLDWIEANVWP